MTAPLHILHSITRVGPEHRGGVLVTGSHGGLFAAAVAARAGVAAVIFNDASGGKDDAGVEGVAWLDQFGVPAGAVSHWSAPIGDGSATLHSGVLSVVNGAANALGCRVYDPVSRAVPLLAKSTVEASDPGVDIAESRSVVRREPGLVVVALDSASLVTADDANALVVTGSHGALLGGEPASALKVDTRGAVFNDAGRGPDGRGTTRLPALDARGIPAVTVDAATARIGDARSAWTDGVISVVNDHAGRLGVQVGMSLPDFADRLLSTVHN